MPRIKFSLEDKYGPETLAVHRLFFALGALLIAAVLAQAGSDSALQRIEVYAPAAPVAAFEVVPLSGLAPLTVTIDGGCSGIFTDEIWDLGATRLPFAQHPRARPVPRSPSSAFITPPAGIPSGSPVRGPAAPTGRKRRSGSGTCGSTCPWHKK